MAMLTRRVALLRGLVAATAAATMAVGIVGPAMAQSMRDSPVIAVSMSYKYASQAAPAGVRVQIRGPWGIRERFTTKKPGGFRYGYRLPRGRYTITATLNPNTSRSQTLRQTVNIVPPRDGRAIFLFR